jgi:hypothetical protein
VEWKSSLKQNKIRKLTIRNDYTFERVENFKYVDVLLNEDNNHQIVIKIGQCLLNTT